MSRRKRDTLAKLPTLPLLITESMDEFDYIRDAVNQELKPSGAIVQLYVADIVDLTWEIQRFRRCKAGIINLTFRPALQKLLAQLLREPGQPSYSSQNEADELAQRWFTDQAAKKQVAELLRRFRLDEFAIEAEAVRESASSLEHLDRLLASLESRRIKALRCLAEYRNDRELRKGTDRIIDGKVLKLEHDSSKKSSAAA